MIIKNVNLETVCGITSRLPENELPEIAFAGKSNVGKSSFINMLANRKKLARVSKDPGRTRLGNYFDFGPFILADLPGYGFAKVSREEKARWARLMEDFFADRSNCAHAFALCDVRHNPTADDVNMVNFLYAGLIPFTVIATKADKLSRMAANNGVKNIAATLKCGTADVILTSSETRQGLQQVYERLERIIELYAEPDEEGEEESDMKNSDGGED